MCDFVSISDANADVDLGVIDSIYNPGGSFEQFNRIERSERLVNTDKDATTPHGNDIAGILGYLTTDSIFHFYQIINKNGKYRDRDLVNAIVWAADYGVDVLNISLGSDHFSNSDKDCDQTGPDCAITEAAEYAVERGVVIVAAVGNEPNANAVCCPALSKATIGVGGCVAYCNASIPDDMINQPSFRPPHSYWVERPDGEGISGTFCSTKGCAPGKSCKGNQSIETWDRNTRFVYHTPDTLAPITYPRLDSKGPLIGGGTSFAAPIVAAAIVGVVEVLKQEGIDINPNEIRRTIRVTGDELQDVPVGVLNAADFTAELLDQHGLGPLRPDDSSSLYRT